MVPKTKSPIASPIRVKPYGAVSTGVLFMCLAAALNTNAQSDMPELVVQTGHMVGIHGLAFSPRVPWGALGFPERNGSGEVLAVGGNDEILELWDTRTNRQIRTLPSPGGAQSVAFSSDGTLVAVGCAGGVLVWSVAAGTLLHDLRGSRGLYQSLAFDSTGLYLAGGAREGITVWNLKRESVEQEWKGSNGSVAFSNQSLLAASTESGPVQAPTHSISIRGTKDLNRELYSSSEAGKVEGLRFQHETGLIVWVRENCQRAGACNHLVAWDFTSNARTQLSGPGQFPLAAGFCLDGGHAVLGTNLGDVLLWDIAKQSEIFHSIPNGSFTDAIACNSDHTLIASAEMRGRVFLWRPDSKKPAATLTGVVNEVDYVSFAPGPKIISGNQGPSYTFGYTESLSDWDVMSSRGPSIAKGGLPVAVSSNTQQYAWLAKGNNRSQTKTIITFNDGGLDKDSSIKADRGTRLAFSWSGRALAVANERQIAVWDVDSQTKKMDLPQLHTFGIEQLAFGSNGDSLASAADDGTVIVWDLAAKKDRCRLGQFQTPEHAVWAVTFNTSGNLLASGGNDRLINLWNPGDCTPVRSWSPDIEVVKSLAFSPNANRLASGGSNGVTKLWNLDTLDNPLELKGHLWEVESLAFSSTGQFLASGSWDGTIKLWDVPTGHELATLVTFENLRDWAVITPEGLFDSSADGGNLLYWRVENSNELIPLDAFYNDFFHPGLLPEILQGKHPKPPHDLATTLRFPALRTMAQQGLASIQKRDGRILLCLSREAVPSSVKGLSVRGRGVKLEVGTDGFKETPEDRVCTYSKELPPDGGPYELVGTTSDWKSNLKDSGVPHNPDPDVSKSTLHVFTVGVDKYSDAYSPLYFPDADADAIQTFFSQQKAANKAFADVHIWKGLRDETATQQGIRDELSAMAKEVKEDDVVFLFFSGHGRVPPGQEMFYYIPFLSPKPDDTSVVNPAEEREEGISTAMMAEAIRNLSARRVVLIVDACQSGGAVESLGKIGEVKLAIEQLRADQEKDDGRTRHDHEVGVYILAAATPVQEALEPFPDMRTANKENSLLTTVLLQALNSYAPAPDSKIWVTKIFQEVKQELPKLAAKYKSVQTAFPVMVGVDFPIGTGLGKHDGS